MKRSWWIRFSILACIVVGSLMTVTPTLFNLKEGHSFPYKTKMNLGLDLQGGLYMILGIDFNKVYRDQVQTSARKLEFLLKEDKIQAKLGQAVGGEEALEPRFTVILDNKNDMEKAKVIFKENFEGSARLTGDKDGVMEIALNRTYRTQIEEQSVSKSIEVIRNRIDEFGVTEPEIISQGRDRIIVQLPGVRDIENAKALIGRTAKLEFKMVNDGTPQAQLEAWVQKATDANINFKNYERFSTYLEELNNHLKADLPEGHEIAFERVGRGNDNEIRVPYLLESVSRLTGDELQDARVAFDPQTNAPFVSLEFKPQGAKIFENLTGENIGRRMAIVLDGNVYSAPNIQTRIGGGRAQITMGGVGGAQKIMKEAKDLALVLRAGALPVQLDFLEQRTIGPSLGGDSIEKVKLATIIGSGILFLFMMIYYRGSGFIAVGTLILNVLIVFAILIGLEATLTLPGIAGIALTLGMAVDGNIIVYERIREEIKKGHNGGGGATYFKACEQGFDRVFWAIIDTNITSMFVGICLLNFGTGPIRGFAVTLLIGIAATVYTSYFVTKLIFELYMNKVQGKSISI